MKFNLVTDIIQGLVGSVSDAADRFIQTKDEKAAFKLALQKLSDEAEKRSQDALQGAREAYMAEFQYASHKTKFDSFVDGMNRLVRPVVTYGLLAAIFGFVEIPSDINENIWAPLTVVLAFWFGGRLLKRDGGAEVIKSFKK